MPIFAARIVRSSEAEVLIEAGNPDDVRKIAWAEANEIFEDPEWDDQVTVVATPVDPTSSEDAHYFDAPGETVWRGTFVGEGNARRPDGVWVEASEVAAEARLAAQLVQQAREEAEARLALARPTPGQLDFEGGEVSAPPTR